MALTRCAAQFEKSGWDGFAGQTGSVRFWDALTGDPIGALGVVGEYVRAADLSSDGSRLAVSIVPIGGAGRVDILDTATATTVATVTGLGPTEWITLPIRWHSIRRARTSCAWIDWELRILLTPAPALHERHDAYPSRA